MNSLMFYVPFVFVLVWGALSFIVIVDMLRQNTAIGCLGIILFPLLPFICVLTRYKGNRKIVAPALFLSALIAFGGAYFQFQRSKTAIAEFIASTEVNGLNCKLKNYGSSNGASYYKIICFEKNPIPQNYANVEGLVKLYKEEFVDSLAPQYLIAVREQDRHDLILAIYTPSGFAVCNKINPDGIIIQSWYSGTEELCE
jgi:hypothetical protein